MSETLAAANTINEWIAEQGDIAPGTPFDRGLGYAKFDLRGTMISALAQPFRFYRLRLAQDAYASLSPDDRRHVDTMLDACNMTPVPGATLTRAIGRKNNREVWL